MRCDKSASNCFGANISQRDATIFLLFVDLIISTLCVFLFVTTYFCNSSDAEFDETNTKLSREGQVTDDIDIDNNWFLYTFFIWHASKLLIVSLGIIGALKSIPSYLIPYICYWGFLTAFLLLYSLFVVIVSVTKIENTEEDYADPLEASETSTSYPLPTNKILEPTNVPEWVLEYSLNNVPLILAIFLVIAAFSGYLTIVVQGFYKSLKNEVQKIESQLAEPPEVTDLPAEV